MCLHEVNNLAKETRTVKCAFLSRLRKQREPAIPLFFCRLAPRTGPSTLHVRIM